MKSSKFLDAVSRKLNDGFESQDPELFDVTFDIEGKKLYADKYRLSMISSTFKSMLSDRWSCKNEAVPITDYKFEDFKELLTFIYSGECRLTDKNIFIILDMAEFYQIEHLKELCDEYLSKMELNSANVFHMIELSSKYSLISVKYRIHDFVCQDFSTFAKSGTFMNADKSLIKELVTMEPKIHIKPEELFQAVYEWAENQANLKKQLLSNNENFKMNDAITNEMQEFLPLIEFKKMESSFLLKFVVQRAFLFTSEEFADISECSNSNIRVKITNNLGQSMFGVLSKENNDAIEIIKTINHSESLYCSHLYIYWDRKRQLPSTPSFLKKRYGVSWYLIYDKDGYICAKHSFFINDNDYLLAEMFAETDFEYSRKWKIEID